MGWIECFCCGCPALDGALDFPECAVCGWDGDGDGLDAARATFSRCGWVHAQLDPLLPHGDEAPHTRLGPPARPPEPLSPAHDAALAVVASVAPGEEPGPGFWQELHTRLQALRRIRGEHVSGGTDEP